MQSARSRLSALQALENRYNDHPVVQDVLIEPQQLGRKCKVIIFCWVPSHVDIPGNERADKAAKASLDLDVSLSRVPHTDFKLLIHSYIYAEWQSFWDEQVENKLHKVKPMLGPCTPIYDLSRRDQLVMSRARIGHTYLTQGYLLQKKEAPVCVPCREWLTVEHVLVHCQHLSDTRERFYECHSMGELFSSINIYQILNFLREIGVYFY